jgi:hypothetical protein
MIGNLAFHYLAMRTVKSLSTACDLTQQILSKTNGNTAVRYLVLVKVQGLVTTLLRYLASQVLTKIAAVHYLVLRTVLALATTFPRRHQTNKVSERTD